MTDSDDLRIFFEIHHDNPQEGPGDFASTKRAFSSLQDLPPLPLILDAGCGPGRQTLDLCRLTDGPVVAVDFHRPYLESLRRKAVAQGARDRVSVVQGDMGQLGFAPRRFDVIWSEGAVYIVGFKAGLEMWRPLLKDGGYVVVSELTRLRSDAPEEGKAFWEGAYPQMQNIESNLSDLRAAGYAPVAHFTLPESAWWDYYRPIEKRIGAFKETYKNDGRALEILEMELQEMDAYRRYFDYYGYVFYIGQAV